MGAGKAQPKGVTCARHCQPPAWAPAHPAPHPLTVPGKDLPSQHRGPHTEASLFPLFLFCASLVDHLGSSRQGIALVRKDLFSMQIRRFLKKVVMFSESCGPPLPGPRVALTGLLQSSLELGPLLSSAALGARPGPAPTWELSWPWPSVFVS